MSSCPQLCFRQLTSTVTRFSFMSRTSCTSAWYVHEWDNMGTRSTFRSSITSTLWSACESPVGLDQRTRPLQTTQPVRTISISSSPLCLGRRHMIPQLLVQLPRYHLRRITSRAPDNRNESHRNNHAKQPFRNPLHFCLNVQLSSSRVIEDRITRSTLDFLFSRLCAFLGGGIRVGNCFSPG